MEEKHRFVSLAGTGKFTVTELGADFRIGRKTGPKWLRPYQQAGAAGLRERSRRPALRLTMTGSVNRLCTLQAQRPGAR